MTRNILALLLCAALTLSLAACGGKDAEITTAKQTDDTASSSTTAAGNTTAAPDDGTTTPLTSATNPDTTVETDVTTASGSSTEATTEKPADTTTDKTNVTTAKTTAKTTEKTTVKTTVKTPENTLGTTVEGGPDFTDKEYSAMIERSLVSTGDTARMRRALEKAANGEDITVAYIGGSITEGYMITDKSRCWASLTHQWLCTQYPQSDIKLVNAGLSGTTSTLGCVRAERDVKAYEPDIVFVEFAVNDAQNSLNKQAYESLVRGFLEMDNAPAVVLVFTVIKSGYTCQSQQQMIGEYYNLPMISLNNVIAQELANGSMTWEQYSDDESHPNLWGSTLLANMVENYYQEVMKELDGTNPKVSALPKKAFSSYSFKDMHYLDSTNLTVKSLGCFAENNVHAWFSNGWKHGRGVESSEGSFKFDLKCNSLIIVPKVGNSNGMATIEIYVDGTLKTTINSNRSDGWNNPLEFVVFEESEVKNHSIEIKLTDETASKTFSICCFGYTD